MHRTGPLIVLTIIFAAAFSSCKKDESVNPQISYYSVKGKVFSIRDTTEHLSNVIVNAGGVIDTTDSNGLFNLKQVPGGKVTFTFSYSDFRTLDTTITLSRDTSLSAGLKRERPEIFPNEIGYYWKYVVIDSISSPWIVIDTAVVRITGNGKFWNGRKGKIWECADKNSSWYNSYKHTVALFNDTVFFDSGREYVFPLSVGKKWYNDFRTTEVTAIETVTTYAGRFDNCYKIYTAEYVDNWSDRHTYWFAPGIGVVKETYLIKDPSGGTKSTWLLLDYKLE